MNRVAIAFNDLRKANPRLPEVVVRGYILRQLNKRCRKLSESVGMQKDKRLTSVPLSFTGTRISYDERVHRRQERFFMYWKNFAAEKTIVSNICSIIENKNTHDAEDQFDRTKGEYGRRRDKNS